MSANVESMFYRLETPWHELGTRVEDYLTSAEAIKAAGLDWTVSKRQAQFEALNGDTLIVPDEYHIVRDSDERHLGRVGKVWDPLQNTEAFDFTDAILTEGCDSLDSLFTGECPRYDTAGSLGNGKQVWLLAKMPVEILVQGEDAINMFLLFSNGHDGKHAVQVAITPVRVVCQNTLNLALRETKQKFTIRHSSQMRDKVEAARLALGLTFAYAHEFEDVANRLASIEVNLDGFKRLAKEIAPQSDDIQNRIVDKWQTTNTLTDDMKKTGWGAVNAVGEYFQWGRNPYKGAESRFANDMFGDSAVARDKAVKLLLAR